MFLILFKKLTGMTVYYLKPRVRDINLQSRWTAGVTICMFLCSEPCNTAMDAIIYSLSIWALDGVLGFRRASKQVLRARDIRSAQFKLKNNSRRAVQIKNLYPYAIYWRIWTNAPVCQKCCTEFLRETFHIQNLSQTQERQKTGSTWDVSTVPTWHRDVFGSDVLSG